MTVNAASLAGDKHIAIWPTHGWWQDHANRSDAQTNYALVVTIDAGDADIDLYSLVSTRIPVSVEVN
jgi:hypothetical protein